MSGRLQHFPSPQRTEFLLTDVGEGKREEQERIKRLEELEAKRKEEVCFCEVADIDTFYLNPLLITHL